jgi:hypothetical protein
MARTRRWARYNGIILRGCTVSKSLQKKYRQSIKRLYRRFEELEVAVVLLLDDQGTGPIVVILPSLAHGANDYDVVGPFLIEAGYRVVRPQPCGIGKSTGSMDKLT